MTYTLSKIVLHLIASKEHKIMRCFLHPDPRNNTIYDEEDILTHTDMTRDVTMLSNAISAAVQMQTMDETFQDCIRTLGKMMIPGEKGKEN